MLQPTQATIDPDTDFPPILGHQPRSCPLPLGSEFAGTQARHHRSMIQRPPIRHICHNAATPPSFLIMPASPVTTFRDDQAFSHELDAADPLRPLRALFHIPPAPGGGDSIYLTGNSLGLQPKATRALIEQELDDWARL